MDLVEKVFKQLAQFIYLNRTTILLIILAVLITWVTTKNECKPKSQFINKSPIGFYYDTDTQTFETAKDKSIAIAALVELLKKDGGSYSPDQLSHLSDRFILMILDPEDDTELEALKARLVILIDPTYQDAFKATIMAQSRGNVYYNDQERTMVYDLLVKYFQKLGVNIVGREKWTDKLLVRTFRTLKMPANDEFLK